MPTAQFYRVSVDNMFPYRLYAGQQDNTSIRIENTAIGRYSISRENWTYSAGGESAFLAYDPDDPRYVLGGSYLGTIEVLDQQAKSGTKIMAAPIQYLGRAASDMKYRFNWNAPIIRSQHEPNTFYHGAQVLLRTKDMGQTWEEASPDLTKNDKSRQIKGGGPYTVEAVGAENYGTLSYVIESPHEAGTIWTGSDDGVVQLTRDNGASWTNVTPKGLEDCLVNAIDVSPHDPGTAYIATTRYKFNDHTPAMYKTTNYGKSWTNISEGIPYGAFTRVIREDDVKKDLLYAGTETGVYVSWNGGRSWQPLQLNLPITPITDMLVKEGDLVVATSGRSFWILDDLTLIRQFDPKSKALQLFDPQDAILANWGSPMNGNSSDGTNPFEGVNPPSGVTFYYHLPELADSIAVTLTITDAQGNEVRKLTTQRDPDYQRYAGGPPSEPTISAKAGLNRFVWDMRYANMPGVPTAYIEGSYRRHQAVPGDYTATLAAGTNTQEVQFKILPHPMYELSADVYQEYHQAMTEMENNLTDMHHLINDLKSKQDQIGDILSDLDEAQTTLREMAEALLENLKKWDEAMVQRKSKAYDDVENFENKFTANYLFLINQTQSDITRVTQASKDRRAELDKKWQELKVEGTTLRDQDIPALNKALWAAGVGAVN